MRANNANLNRFKIKIHDDNQVVLDIDKHGFSLDTIRIKKILRHIRSYKKNYKEIAS